MRIRPLKARLEKYLVRHGLVKKYKKQGLLLSQSYDHPSLNVELMEPKNRGVHSFRIDRKYRVVFVFLDKDQIEVIDINNHYQ